MALLKCRICKTAYSSAINHLTAEVDVFCHWLDQCDKVNQPKIPISLENEESQDEYPVKKVKGDRKQQKN